mgnify:CR=1 FL=1
MNIAILILAAGSSSRMGASKQLLPAGKTTLLGVTIEIASQTNANKVFCVLGSNAEAIKNDNPVLKGKKYIDAVNFLKEQFLTLYFRFLLKLQYDCNQVL